MSKRMGEMMWSFAGWTTTSEASEGSSWCDDVDWTISVRGGDGDPGDDALVVGGDGMSKDANELGRKKKIT